jgi:hypothetical protein
VIFFAGAGGFDGGRGRAGACNARIVGTWRTSETGTATSARGPSEDGLLNAPMSRPAPAPATAATTATTRVLLDPSMLRIS